MPNKEVIDIKKTLPSQIWSSNQLKKEETGVARPPLFWCKELCPHDIGLSGFFFKFIINIQRKGFKVEQSKEDKLKLVIKAFY